MSNAIREAQAPASSSSSAPPPFLAGTTVLVVPCYNEAARLPIEDFREFASRTAFPLRILFVNDGSTDQTLERLRLLKEFDPQRFDILDLSRNSGKAEAVRQGILHALRQPSGWPSHVGFMDADLATPLDALIELRETLEADPALMMAMGSRIRLLGRKIERQAIRHYLGRTFATAASLLLGLPVYDTQCGAKLFRAGPKLGELFAEPFLTRWIFDVEILARLVLQARRGASLPVERMVYELPLREWRDVAGSKVRPRDFARAIWEFVLIQRRYFAGAARPANHDQVQSLSAPAPSSPSTPTALQEMNSPC